MSRSSLPTRPGVPVPYVTSGDIIEPVNNCHVRGERNPLYKESPVRAWGLRFVIAYAPPLRGNKAYCRRILIVCRVILAGEIERGTTGAETRETDQAIVRTIEDPLETRRIQNCRQVSSERYADLGLWSGVVSALGGFA